MSDLRQRLDEALEGAADFQDTYASTLKPEEAAPVALSVFAAWLRDLALMEDSSWLPKRPYALEDDRLIVGAALDALATKIAGREQG